MSTTFFPTETASTKYVVECIQCHMIEATYVGWADAHAAAIRTRVEHEQGECDEGTVYASPAEPAVNMSGSNALVVLDALGLDREDSCGSLPAEDFMGRVLVALAVAPIDAGKPTTDFGSDGGAGMRVIDGGRRPGYLQETLTNLRDVAQFAYHHSTTVTWS